MRKALKYVVFAVSTLLLLAVAGFSGVYLTVEGKQKKTVQVDVKPVAIPTDEAALAEGRRLVQAKGCYDCHGQNLAGKVVVDEPPIGRFVGPNLTAGKGGVVAGYTDTDWVRSIRHGVSREGRYLRFMPSHEFHALSDEDLGRMISYLKTAAPVDQENPEMKIGPVARVMYVTGNFPMMFPAELIDPAVTPPEKVTPEASAAYGKYLAAGCVGCHGNGYSGGPIAGVPPSWPAAANITPSGRVASWSLAEFKKVMREGVTPDGRQINSQFMPWPAMSAMTDLEIEALFLFLKSLPARAAGTH